MKLVYEVMDGTPVITLTSQDGQNKLDTNALLSIPDLLNRVQAEGYSCVVITGEGSNFCLGGNLAGASGSYEHLEAFGRVFTDTLLSISRRGPIIIAAVNGAAAGGGMSLLEACDLAVACEDAVFSIPEVRGGMPPVISYTGTYRMLGRKRTNELALFGGDLSAAQALQLGMVNRVVKKCDVLKTAFDMAKAIEKNGAFCNREIKSLSGRMDHDRMERQLKSAADRLNGIALANSLKKR